MGGSDGACGTGALVGQIDGRRIREGNGTLCLRAKSPAIRNAHARDHGRRLDEVSNRATRGFVAKEAHGVVAKEAHGVVAKEAHGVVAKEAHGVVAKEAHGVVAKEARGVAAKQAHAMRHYDSLE